MAYNSFNSNSAVAGNCGQLVFSRTNNFAAVGSGDLLGQLQFLGFDGTTFQTASFINISATGAPAVNIPSKLQFYSSTGTGTQLAMTIGENGQVTLSDPFINQATLIVNNNQSTPNINLRTANATATNAPHVHFNRSRAGTADVAASDELGRLEFLGFQGGTAREAAEIASVAQTVNGTNAVSGYLSFRTVPTTYAAMAERVRISADGNVTISTPVSGIALTIVGGGETITAGDLTITSGNVYLPNTTSTPIGVVFQGGNRFIHTFGTSACTYIGQNAGSINVANTSSNTTAVGNGCLTSITSGNDNVAMGGSALATVTTQGNNVAVGTRTLTYSTGNDNVAIGFDALRGFSLGSASGTKNVAIGSTANRQNSSGSDNVYIGYQAGLTTTGGAQNVVIGSQAFANANASQNVVIGYQAGNASTGFTACTVVGKFALNNTNAGLYNLMLGYGSGTNYTGAESSNICLHSDGVLGDNNTLRIGQSTGTGNRQIQNAYIQGYVNLPGQPSFHAYISTAQNNVTGDGTNYNVIFQTERHDISSSYNNATGVFTAPASGRYMFTSQVIYEGLTAGMTWGALGFWVNGAAYVGGVSYVNPIAAAALGSFYSNQGTVIMQLSAGDTVQVRIFVTGGAKVADLNVQTASFFAGQLLS